MFKVNPIIEEILARVGGQRLTTGRLNAESNAVRMKYIERFRQLRNGREVMVYYSGWGQCANATLHMDETALYRLTEACRTIEGDKGLDFFIRTPGGGIGIAEKLVRTLLSKFKSDIEVFVPHVAMSAGTLIACASKQIHMGEGAGLGAIDPIINDSRTGLPVSARTVIKEFDMAADPSQSDPTRARIWQMRIGSYHPGIIPQSQDAIRWIEKLATAWLEGSMFYGDDDARERSQKVCKALMNDFDHSHYISKDEARDIGIKVATDEPELSEVITHLGEAYSASFDLCDNTHTLINTSSGYGALRPLQVG